MQRQILVLMALTLFTQQASFAMEAAPRPNIVFIMADDLGWADVAFHGGNVPTPHLDRLAAEGLELTQHYVAPVCSPTRSGLLTGRCWSRFGVTTPTNELALPIDTVTLPRALKSVDYDTCLIGKWHLGSLPKWGPNHFGFDHTYGSLAGGISPWNHRYKKGPYTVTWHRNEELIDETGHVTDLLTNEAVEWIETRDSSPFFLYVPYTAVHLPVKEPQEWLGRVPDSISGDVPRHYAACILHLDDAVGRIIAALEKKGVRDNTLLVFTSDNGGSTAENNDLKYPDDSCPNGRLPGNNHPLRGQKGTVYEGGTRVPTIVSWPARVQAGAAASPVQITDWMPTFCSLAGYESEVDLAWDGADLSRLLLTGEPLPDRPIYTAGPRWRGRSLRYGDWKLVVHDGDGGRTLELFNIADDPGEAADLAAKKPQRTEQMLAQLRQIARADRSSIAVTGTREHRDLVFATVDGKPLKLDLYVPDTQTKPPLLVWIHGGGWRAGSKSKSPLFKLTQAGFAIASISYRFTDTAIFPAQIHDCKGAVRWLRANASKYGYDAEWIAVAGSSAGGHLALLMGTSGGVAALEGEVGGNPDQPSTVQAVIDYFGPSDFVLRGKTQPDRSYTAKSGSFALLGGVKHGEVDPKLEVQASPVTYVDANDPPLLIFQGTDDKTVLLDQSERIASVYNAAGLDVTLVVLDGAGHGGRRFFSSEHFNQAREFLKTHRPAR